MKVVAVVPMKLNNQRLPNKNTKLFTNGRPLCSYILKTLKKVKSIDEIYVFCSDEKIKEYLPENIKYLKRNSDLDKDTTTMNEVLNEFIKEIDASIYVLAHATAPFIKQSSFEKCINELKNGHYDSAFSAQKVQEFLWKDGRPINYNLENIPRTQELPIIYKETCGFYIFKKDILTKYNRRIGVNPYIYEVDEIEGTDIDNGFDFEIADYIVNKYEVE